MTAREIAAVRAKAALDAVYLEWIRQERASIHNGRFPGPARTRRGPAAPAAAGEMYFRLASRPLP